jgi:hypothetical protein
MQILDFVTPQTTNRVSVSIFYFPAVYTAYGVTVYILDFVVAYAANSVAVVSLMSVISNLLCGQFRVRSFPLF